MLIAQLSLYTILMQGATTFQTFGLFHFNYLDCFVSNIWTVDLLGDLPERIIAQQCDRFLMSRDGKILHGIGLQSINRIVDKHSGHVDIKANGGGSHLSAKRETKKLQSRHEKQQSMHILFIFPLFCVLLLLSSQLCVEWH